jgi:hypothetical protein
MAFVSIDTVARVARARPRPAFAVRARINDRVLLNRRSIAAQFHNQEIRSGHLPASSADTGQGNGQAFDADQGYDEFRH